ncbi:GNAT family N-acetyltransferase [Candidatus Lokiarchaeum ossiferum]|uniref:GNAT family N-acetyltransferase n=1 Tax=Candidatus Lokiarchaeum ossiferum TaxID=2951803 RepID=UPI00352F8373
MVKIAIYCFSEESISEIKHICRDFKHFECYSIYFKDPYYQVYVASIKEKKVGFIVLSRHSYNLYGDFLWVDEDYRNGKVGTELLQLAIEKGKKEGYRSFIGDTLSTNKKAQKLYERIGATKFGEFINLYGEGKEKLYQYRIVIEENLNKNLK